MYASTLTMSITIHIHMHMPRRFVTSPSMQAETLSTVRNQIRRSLLSKVKSRQQRFSHLLSSWYTPYILKTPLTPSLERHCVVGSLSKQPDMTTKMLDAAAVTSKVKELNEANAKGRTEVGVSKSAPRICL